MKKSPFTFEYLLGGYSSFSTIFNNAFNFSLAFIFLIISIPAFVIVSLIIKLQDSGSIFYKGRRLGKNKKIFLMYKFRTLIPDAENLIGAELLSTKQRLETKTGKFLRDARLDELPQILNILKGDMNFLGPRPERPAIYEKFCKHIKGYDKRFSVKPGLIGYSQLFTPHNTPKRIRATIDNRFIDKRQHILVDVIIIFYTMLVLLGVILRKSERLVRENIIQGKKFSKTGYKRSFERIALTNVKVSIIEEDDSGEKVSGNAFLADINDEAFRIVSEKELDLKDKDNLFKLETELYRPTGIIKKKKKVKTVLCRGNLFRRTVTDDNASWYSYVINYTPVSPLNSYMLHQYFLGKSVI